MVQDEHEFLRLKAATRDLIKACGGIERAATVVGLSGSQISRCHNRAAPDLLTWKAKLALERDCEEPIVTRVELELQGFAIADRVAPALSGFNVHSSFARLANEAGDAMSRYGEAIADGRISPAEAMTIDAAIAALVRACKILRRALLPLIAVGSGDE